LGHDANLTAAELIEKRDHGHGHVYPRRDGLVARCGGPNLCHVCASDLAEKHSRETGRQTKVDRLVRLPAVLLDGPKRMALEIESDGSVPDIVILHNMAYLHAGFDAAGKPQFRRKTSYNAFNKTWWKVENWE
jgi:hypothetical protein